jgi:hypothetical protein
MERPPLPAGAGGGAAAGTSKPNKGRRNNSNNKRNRVNRANNGNNNNSNGPNHNHKNSNNRNNSAPKGPPPAPVVKVTIRNIQNAEQYGTSQKVIDGLIRTLVERANEKMPVDQKVELVQSNLEEVILLEQNVMQVKKDLEEKVKKELEEKARKELEEKAEKEKAKTPDDANGEHAKDEEEQQQDIPESPAPAEDTKEPIVEDTAVVAVIPAMQNLWLSDKSKPNGYINDSSGPSTTTGIAARVLYICPPKKTRRRGEKPGCAYLLLTAPTIEAKTPVPAAIVPAAIVENGGVETVTPAAPAPTTTPVAEIDYTQEVTKRRLQLQLAIESMTNYATDNAKAKQDLACCVVEESIDSKTWKVNYRPFRSQGVSVEDTADYKQFVERTEQEKEERSARPKPPPGGSIAASAALAATENGQPMAALVLHLRAMHDEQSKRNKAKRKGRDAGKRAPPKGKEQDGGGGGGAGSKQQQDAAKKSKGRKKKKAPIKKPAPPKVLKAASSGGSGAPSASASVWNKG